MARAAIPQDCSSDRTPNRWGRVTVAHSISAAIEARKLVLFVMSEPGKSGPVGQIAHHGRDFPLRYRGHVAAEAIA